MDITEQYQKQQQEIKGIQSVIDEGWALIEFGPDGKILNANVNFLELFEYQQLDNIIGQRHEIFCDQRFVKSGDYDVFWEKLRNGHIQSGEFRRKSKSGKDIWINASYSPVKNDNGEVLKIIKIAADISKRKRAEQRAQGIQSVINEGWAFVEFSPDGILLDANSNFIELFGYATLNDIQGQHHRIFCDDHLVDSADYKQFWNDLRQGFIQSGEFERRTKTGERVWINSSYSPVKNENGEVIKVMKIAADITESKQLAAELDIIRAKELEDAQTQLVQSEKMASLGNLMAGIAHEINTPLGAIKASIEGILDSQTSYTEFHDITRLLSNEEMSVFLQMLDHSLNYQSVLSSREERQAKRKLRHYLEDEGVVASDEIADMMTDMHLFEKSDAYAPLWKHNDNKNIFEAALGITVQNRNGKTIKMAVDKASKIIFALKSYAHFDGEESFVDANLTDGIENIITLYSNMLKQGIELEKQIDDVPEVSCLPDQLGQVWTNLISNAIHAMKGRGTLSIKVENHSESVCVKIGDTGAGIPDDIKNHIFSAFFTTKSSGEGSGLGLDLVKKIVDKHGGEISFESEPGCTVFSVEIPKKEHINQRVTERLQELNEAKKNQEEDIKKKLEIAH